MAAEIGPAELADIVRVGKRMRAIDRWEIYASCGMNRWDALRVSVDLSNEVHAGRLDGEAVCLFGVASPVLLGDVWRPWLLATPGIERVPMTFLRRNCAVVAEWRDRYPLLENYVAARNETAVAWLRWLGFTIEPAAPFGPLRVPFHRFHMRGTA